MALLFFGIGMKTDPFPDPVATAEFSKFAGVLSAALSQNHLSGFEITDYIDSLKVSSHRIIIKFKDKKSQL